MAKQMKERKRGWTWTIYLLRDPRDDRPMRVGKTQNLGARIYQYRIKNPPMISLVVKAWTAELREAGLQPKVEILATVSADDFQTGDLSARAVETTWIRRLTAENPQLLNHAKHVDERDRKIAKIIRDLQGLLP